jgi:hypothetical protein
LFALLIASHTVVVAEGYDAGGGGASWVTPRAQSMPSRTVGKYGAATRSSSARDAGGGSMP